MLQRLHAISIRSCVRLWFLVLLGSVLAGCGGGGAGPSLPVHVPGVVNGQVVKGLTSGASVSLYIVEPDGQRAIPTSAGTDARGSFSLSQVLQAGCVYLLKAIGGQYRHEVTGLIETLVTPWRGVFVAIGTELHFAVDLAASMRIVTMVDPWLRG